jgi:glutamate synthase (NADPH/NADH) large chain
MLQTAVTRGAYQLYKNYAEAVYARPPISLRDLMGFKPVHAPIAREKVEPVVDIRKRFVAPAMSLGELSPEAHEILAIAMNRIGATSNSGEGGEGAERYNPRSNGDNANSTINNQCT